MQKEIYKEDYFGTLMSVLTDEARRIMPTFNPTKELHKIQNDMCKAGSWIDSMPIGTIVQSHQEPTKITSRCVARIQNIGGKFNRPCNL